MAKSLKTVLVSNGKSRLFERGQLDGEESTTFLAWEMPLGFVFVLSFVHRFSPKNYPGKAVQPYEDLPRAMPVGDP